MAVYFVYRSAYESPLGRRLVRFDDETLRQWFESRWVTRETFAGADDTWSSEWLEHAQTRTHAVFGSAVYGFHAIWRAMLERGEPPASGDNFVKWLEGAGYPEGEIIAQPHVIQIPTDDDELDLAILMFDDHFAAAHPERVAFALREERALPEEIEIGAAPFAGGAGRNDLAPSGDGEGTLYAIFVVIHDTSWLIDLYGAFCFAGVRLPGFVEHLRTRTPSLERTGSWKASIGRGSWPHELKLLRWAALSAGPRATLESVLRAVDVLDADRAVEAISAAALASSSPEHFFMGDEESCARDWQLIAHPRERDVSSAWIRTRQPSFVQAAEHVAQIAFTDVSVLSMDESMKVEHNTQWFFFDDLWAASHPELAASMLRWASEQLPL